MIFNLMLKNCKGGKVRRHCMTGILNILSSNLESIKVAIAKLAKRSIFTRVTQAKSDLREIGKFRSQIDSAILRFNASQSQLNRIRLLDLT
jgi:hypothetical protein